LQKRRPLKWAYARFRGFFILFNENPQSRQINGVALQRGIGIERFPYHKGGVLVFFYSKSAVLAGLQFGNGVGPKLSIYIQQIRKKGGP
jgi:hypothetical protein